AGWERRAELLQGVARVQGMQRENRAAMSTAKELLALREKLAGEAQSPEALDALADAEALTAMALQRLAETQEALPHARRAVEIAKIWRASAPPTRSPNAT